MGWGWLGDKGAVEWFSGLLYMHLQPHSKAVTPKLKA